MTRLGAVRSFFASSPLSQQVTKASRHAEKYIKLEAHTTFTEAAAASRFYENNSKK